MRKRQNIQFWWERSKNLVTKPTEAWQEIFTEEDDYKSLFANYFLPFFLLLSIPIFLLSFRSNSLWYAIRYTLSDFTSSVVGIYLAYLCIRTYLSDKIQNAEHIASTLTIYSCISFLFFSNLSATLSYNFLSQLLILFSLIFLRTLHAGVQEIHSLETQQKTNVFIIAAISITCIPIIIKKLLLILLNFPILNL